MLIESHFHNTALAKEAILWTDSAKTLRIATHDKIVYVSPADGWPTQGGTRYTIALPDGPETLTVAEMSEGAPVIVTP